MRWIKSLEGVVLLIGCCCGQVSPNAATKKSTMLDPGYSITVAPPSDPIRLGSAINIIVIVTVKNVSDREMYWESEFADTAYRAFTVLLTKNGTEVETTFFCRKVRSTQRPGDPPEVEHGGSILSSVAPGKSFTFAIDLERLYAIAEPGLYTLDVSRSGNDNITIVRAKPLTLKIVR